jgi:hypothetical protein
MILNLFGFDPPSGEKAVNPVGNDACALIRTKAGSASAFSKQRHAMVRSFNHNTNETFVPLGGMWRFTWESSPAHTEFVDLGPCDTIGRVHFNLAESRRDPESPFAFMASDTTQLFGAGQSTASGLAGICGSSDRDKLLSLLVPVQRAAEKFPG